jgi:ribosome-associated translation inhibitor RaiA
VSQEGQQRKLRRAACDLAMQMITTQANRHNEKYVSQRGQQRKLRRAACDLALQMVTAQAKRLNEKREPQRATAQPKQKERNNQKAATDHGAYRVAVNEHAYAKGVEPDKLSRELQSAHRPTRRLVQRVT